MRTSCDVTRRFAQSQSHHASLCTRALKQDMRCNLAQAPASEPSCFAVTASSTNGRKRHPLGQQPKPPPSEQAVAATSLARVAAAMLRAPMPMVKASPLGGRGVPEISAQGSSGGGSNVGSGASERRFLQACSGCKSPPMSLTSWRCATTRGTTAPNGGSPAAEGASAAATTLACVTDRARACACRMSLNRSAPSGGQRRACRRCPSEARQGESLTERRSPFIFRPRGGCRALRGRGAPPMGGAIGYRCGGRGNIRPRTRNVRRRLHILIGRNTYTQPDNDEPRESFGGLLY